MTVDTFKLAAVRASEKALQDYFDGGVRRIFAPFDPGCVHIQVSSGRTFTRIFRIDIPAVKNHPLLVELNLIGEPYDIVDHILWAVQKHYNNSYIEPENHIVLGED